MPGRQIRLRDWFLSTGKRKRSMLDDKFIKGVDSDAKQRTGSEDKVNFLDYEKKFALFVGFSDYTKFCRLDYVSKEIERISALLENDYFFSVRKISDPDFRLNPNVISKSIFSFIDDVTEESLFLFYYGGYGKKVGNTGYLIPPGEDIEGYVQKYISFGTILEDLKTLRCKHRILILDCCRAGQLIKGTRKSFDDEEITYERKSVIDYDKAAIAMMACGSDEEISARSPFAEAFYDALSRHIQPGRVVSPVVLGNFICSRVGKETNLHPNYTTTSIQGLVGRGKIFIYRPHKPKVSFIPTGSEFKTGTVLPSVVLKLHHGDGSAIDVEKTKSSIFVSFNNKPIEIFKNEKKDEIETVEYIQPVVYEILEGENALIVKFYKIDTGEVSISVTPYNQAGNKGDTEKEYYHIDTNPFTYISDTVEPVAGSFDPLPIKGKVFPVLNQVTIPLNDMSGSGIDYTATENTVVVKYDDGYEPSRSFQRNGNDLVVILGDIKTGLLTVTIIPIDNVGNKGILQSAAYSINTDKPSVVFINPDVSPNKFKPIVVRFIHSPEIGIDVNVYKKPSQYVKVSLDDMPIDYYKLNITQDCLIIGFTKNIKQGKLKVAITPLLVDGIRGEEVSNSYSINNNTNYFYTALYMFLFVFLLFCGYGIHAWYVDFPYVASYQPSAESVEYYKQLPEVTAYIIDRGNNLSQEKTSENIKVEFLGDGTPTYKAIVEDDQAIIQFTQVPFSGLVKISITPEDATGKKYSKPFIQTYKIDSDKPLVTGFSPEPELGRYLGDLPPLNIFLSDRTSTLEDRNGSGIDLKKTKENIAITCKGQKPEYGEINITDNRMEIPFTKVYSGEVTVTVTPYDDAGNDGETVTRTYMIDTDKPVAGPFNLVPEPGQFFNTLPPTLVVPLNDMGGSKIDVEKTRESIVITSNGNKPVHDEPIVTEKQVEIPFQSVDTSDITILVTPVDKAGNIGDPLSETYRIDKGLPEVLASHLSPIADEKEYYKENDIQTIIFDIIDTPGIDAGGSGIDRDETQQNISVTPTGGQPELGEITVTDTKVEIPFKKVSSGEITIVITPCDKAGNKGNKTERIYRFDLDPPMAGSGIDKSFTVKFLTSATIPLSDRGGSGINIQETNSHISIIYNNEDITKKCSIIVSNEEIKIDTIGVTEEGTVDIAMTPIDNAGNAGRSIIYKYIIDPTLIIDRIPPVAGRFVPASSTERYIDRLPSITISLSDEGGSEIDPDKTKENLSVDYQCKGRAPIPEKIVREDRALVKFPHIKSGRVTIAITPFDKSGNQGDRKSGVYLVDVDPPRVDSYEPEAVSRYVNALSRVIISFYDTGGSGIDINRTRNNVVVSYTGQVTKPDYNITSIAETKLQIDFTTIEDGEITLSVTPVDRAGNAGERVEKIYKYDKTPPRVIAFDPIREQLTAPLLHVTVDLSDAGGSGIDADKTKENLSIERDSVNIKDKVNISISDNRVSIENQSVGSGHTAISIVPVDKAGNIGTASRKTYTYVELPSPPEPMVNEWLKILVQYKEPWKNDWITNPTLPSQSGDLVKQWQHFVEERYLRFEKDDNGVTLTPTGSYQVKKAISSSIGNQTVVPCTIEISYKSDGNKKGFIVEAQFDLVLNSLNGKWIYSKVDNWKLPLKK